jgi:hypothetical protein
MQHGVISCDETIADLEFATRGLEVLPNAFQVVFERARNRPFKPNSPALNARCFQLYNRVGVRMGYNLLPQATIASLELNHSDSGWFSGLLAVF